MSVLGPWSMREEGEGRERKGEEGGRRGRKGEEGEGRERKGEEEGARYGRRSDLDKTYTFPRGSSTE